MTERMMTMRLVCIQCLRSTSLLTVRSDQAERARILRKKTLIMGEVVFL